MSSFRTAGGAVAAGLWLAGAAVLVVAAMARPGVVSASGATVSAAVPAETAAAFNRYVRAADARVQSELGDSSRFLTFEFATPGRQAEVRAGLARGGPVIERLVAQADGADVKVPGGAVHHWVGVVFVPGAHLNAAVQLLQDYDRHDEVFAPWIAESRLLSREGDTFRFTMRFVIRKFITAVLQTDQEATFFHPAADRAHSRIHATRIVEIQDAGTRTERDAPPDKDRGYLWRQESYWRFLERDGGVFIQCEVMSLSRPLPTVVGWLFGGSAAAVPRDTLVNTLAAARRELMRHQ